MVDVDGGNCAKRSIVDELRAGLNDEMITLKLIEWYIYFILTIIYM